MNRDAKDLRVDPKIIARRRQLLRQLIARGDENGAAAQRRADESDSRLGKAPAPLAARAEHRSTAPLSFAQQRMWLLEQLADGAGQLFGIPATIRIRGPLKVHRLEEALRQVIRRHEVLRTAFIVDEQTGNPIQRIMPVPRTLLDLVDLRSLPAAQQPALVQSIIAEEAEFPFELTSGRPARFRLLCVSACEHVLVCSMHHMVADGWSMNILLAEVCALYPAGRRAGGVNLPQLTLQYADFAVWQRNAAGAQITGQIDYWKRQLGGEIAVIDLPGARPRPIRPANRAGTHNLWVSRMDSERLHAISRRYGVTPFVTVLSIFKAFLHRCTQDRDVLVGTPAANRPRVEFESLIGLFVNTIVIRSEVRGDLTFAQLLHRVSDATVNALNNQDVPFEQVVDELRPDRSLSYSPLFQVMFFWQNTPVNDVRLNDLVLELMPQESPAAKADLTLICQDAPSGMRLSLEYSRDLFDDEACAVLAEHLRALIASALSNPEQRIDNLDLMNVAERGRILRSSNESGSPKASTDTAEDLLRNVVRISPDAIAIACSDGSQLTYDVIHDKVIRLAGALRELGTGSEHLVGIRINRGPNLLIAMLGVLRSGAAYLPLDPVLPVQRAQFMLRDAHATVLITERALVESTLAESPNVLLIEDALRWNGNAVSVPAPRLHNLAYAIYTSGSTGQPKAVMVSHANLMSFLTAMDQRLSFSENSCWLAMTSISFDISILELLWTTSRGQRIVMVVDSLHVTEAPSANAGVVPTASPLNFSLFYFASGAMAPGRDNYRLLMEGAKFADRHGFEAVWIPERHFHEFGAPYPNPSVLGAALAAVTKNIRIRAGSVVLPLHDPVRVAEEWAVVDNLSDGRVDLSFASGWHPRDFVLQPSHYGRRREMLVEQIGQVRRLWRGESIERLGVDGAATTISTFPRPVQPELNCWLTAAGNPETFRLAGEMGFGVLTHLLGQNITELAEKLRVYRAAWRSKNSKPYVVLAMHTFVGKDHAGVMEVAGPPFANYLRNAVDLLRHLARDLGYDLNALDLNGADLDAVVAHAVNRYASMSGLIGTQEQALRILDQVRQIGVNEVACLIDFGVSTNEALEALKSLEEVRQSLLRRPVQSASHAAARSASRFDSLAVHIRQFQITHVQTTPSLLQAWLADPEMNAAIETLSEFLLGGEPLPQDLAQRLLRQGGPRLLNMYGPTETTVWSSIQDISAAGGRVSIGHAIPQTRLYVLDAARQLVPIGIVGELYIAGAGVARGYLGRSDLTADRFMPCPFGSMIGERMYRTGDRARLRGDGEIELLGRADDQVKIRGVRIEPAEVEAVLRAHPRVRQCAVAARQESTAPNATRLIAFVVAHGAAQTELATAPEALTTSAAAVAEPAGLSDELRQFLRERLPDQMAPSAFIYINAFPLLPGGKLDRKRLPTVAVPQNIRTAVDARNPIEAKLLEVWRELLPSKNVGVFDNFFESGGDSILAIQMTSRAKQVGLHIVPRQVFERQTIAELALTVDENRCSKSNAAAKGPFPLSPMQMWFFEWDLPCPHHYNHAVMLRLRREIQPHVLRAAFVRVVSHHAALRFRFTATATGWQQDIGEDDPKNWFHVINLPQASAQMWAALLEQAASEVSTSLHLADGPLVRCVYFSCGDDGRDIDSVRVMLVAHHIVVDGISWRILLEDLQLACKQLLEGQAISLPKATTQFGQWTEILNENAAAGSLDAQLRDWEQQIGPSAPPIPTDHSEGANSNASAQTVFVRLSEAQTRSVLLASSAHESTITELLLAAVSLAFRDWTVQEALLLDVESYGREELDADVDLSRTVGWHTSLFPVRLISAAGRESVRAVKHQFAKIHRRGQSFGILKYLARDERILDRMDALPSAQVLFNYFGQLDPVLSESTFFALAPESTGAHHGPGGRRRYLLEISGLVIEGMMQFSWTFSAECHNRSTIETLADRFLDQLLMLSSPDSTPMKDAIATSAQYDKFGWSAPDVREIETALQQEFTGR